MDLHQLYIFTKVVEYKSFSKAAESVYLSQSTVSSHIQSLEKLLSVQLFDRVGREVIVTPYGQRLYYWALELLRMKDEALLDLKDSISDLNGDIHIGVSSVPGRFIVPALVKKFREEFPQVTFTLNQYPSRIVAEKATQCQIDIGFLGKKYDDDRLTYVPLSKEKLVLITAKDYVIQAPVLIQDILKHPFIMRNSDSGTKGMLTNFLKQKHINESDFNIVAHTDNSESLIEFVRQGIGISIISETVAKEFAANNILNIHYIDEFDDERYFYLVYNEKKTLSLISKLFIELIKNSTFE